MNKSLIDEKAFDKAMGEIIAYKYIFLVIILFVAIALAYTDFVTQKVGAGVSHFFQELVAAVLAATLISIVYDFSVRKQEALRRDLELRKLLRELSRQTFLSSAFDDLSDPDVSEISQRILLNERFTEALAELTAERSERYSKKAVVGLLHSLWSGSPIQSQKWVTRLLRNPKDSNTYLFESEQRFAWSTDADRNKFRVILTQKAIVGANIVNFDGRRYDGVIAVPKLDETIASQFTMREHHKLTIAFEDADEREIDLKPVLTRYQPQTSQGPDLAGTEVFIVEFDLPTERIRENKRFHIDWYWKSLLSVSEPFCYIQTDSLCFVQELKVEYAEISSLIGRVWVAPFLNRRIKHDRERKQVTAEINGPMMPGQGIALVWDPKPEAGKA